jgi:hypothetical protein
MAFQYSEKVQDAQKESALKIHLVAFKAHLEAIADTLGTSATMKLFTGPLPKSCDAPSPPGEVVVYILPPQPFLKPRDDGKEVVMYNSELWLGDVQKDVQVDDICCFRVFDYLGQCHLQGSVSPEGGGGDLQLNAGDKLIRKGQRVNIGEFVIAIEKRATRQHQRGRVVDQGFVKLKAPPGEMDVWLMSGRRVCPDERGYVFASAGEVAQLSQQGFEIVRPLPAKPATKVWFCAAVLHPAGAA